MIKITKIDKDLSIYKKNKVIIWNATNLGIAMLNYLKEFNIEVYAFCDSNYNLWDTLVESVPVISPFKLAALVRNNENTVVQLTLENAEEERKVLVLLHEIGATNYISRAEALGILSFIKLSELNLNYASMFENAQLWGDYVIFHYKRQQLISIVGPKKPDVLLCLPPKTGDWTVINTLSSNNISVTNLDHTATVFAKEFYESSNQPVKLITAIREPIIQNLSIAYEIISGLSIGPFVEAIYSRYLGHGYDNLEWLKKYKNALLKDGGNAQEFFDLFLEAIGVNGGEKCTAHKNRPWDIQSFIVDFQKNIVDFLAYPFDKEKGYSIVKEGNIEVFVYQLEKLDDLIPELSNWVGVNFANLINSNISENKWIGASYKKAKSEIKISKNYFEKCFSEPYVKHCYSERDIQKFKDKWYKHITY